MRRLPKLRKVCKWTGLVLSVLLLVVWVGSGWWSRTWMVHYSSGHIDVSLGEGRIRFDDVLSGTFVNNRWNPYELHRAPWAVRLWFAGSLEPGFRFIGVPLWFPLLLIVIPTGLLCRTDSIARRRALARLCVKCGYDIRGLNVCPECGTAR